MRRLEDMAEVLVGQIMTRVSSKEDGENQKEVKVLMPGAMGCGFIYEDSLGTAKLIREIDDRYYTRPGDIVMKLTSEYDATVIEDKDEGIVISSLVCVIRVHDKCTLDPYYLCSVLNSNYIKKMFKQNADAAIRPMLKISDIRKLFIPEASYDIQKEVGHLFQLSSEKIKTLEEMIENEKSIMRAIINNTVLEILDNEE